MSTNQTPTEKFDWTAYGKVLVQAQKLSARDMERAISAWQETGGALDSILVSLGLVSEQDAAKALAQYLQLPLITAAQYPDTTITSPQIENISPQFLKTNLILPLQTNSEQIHIAMKSPQDEYAKQAIRLATNLIPVPHVGIGSEIEKALNQNETKEQNEEEELETQDAGDFVEHLRDLASEAPVIRLVNTIISKVIELRASDIHLEPFDDGLHIRYRVDGVLLASDTVPAIQGAAVSSRIKLLAHLDIAERRLPQDGRIKTRVKGRELDLRVSTAPTVHGESVVMRVLDRASVRLSLEDMGFEQSTLTRFNELINKPHGILLVTGPTGSGKTTTLYAALAKLDSTTQKIITVEDPVEYQLEGINQIQVHAQIQLTFANALRAILRQDPDIIMIGEMRDGETAQIAVQSSLTGHLVLSTLHTNTAAAAVIRMQDMGVESYLITSTVNGVLSQRLVRSLCKHCKAPHQVDQHLLDSTGLKQYMQAGQNIYQAVGCEHCRHTGYTGRTGIHELFTIDDEIRSAIIKGSDASSLQNLAITKGMKTLYQDGLQKVAKGITSLDEILRATQDTIDA